MEIQLERSRTVAQMGRGERAVIHKLNGEHLGVHSPCIKLMEMGFTPGQEITLIAKSVFNCPVAVAVRGTIIALRLHEAQCIHI
jgi:ferrous iron transport protein A